MKLKEINLKQFKRFTDLRIENIPDSTKMVVLIGPNGCGKSSLFDAFKIWQDYHTYFCSCDLTYYSKDSSVFNTLEKISLLFDKKIDVDPRNSNRLLCDNIFYFRTAYRNDADFVTTGIGNVPPVFQRNDKKMISNDATVNLNYQRLVGKTLNHVYDKQKDTMKVSELREELIGKIRNSMINLFGDLILTDVGNPLVNGSFYFDKGIANGFLYKNLSGGEKAAFDILLDIIIKEEYYKDTIYCIDEPEVHMHTKLQSELLEEIYRLIPDSCQLWIATHSLGMMRKAKELSQINPGSVAFLDFDNINFDEPVILEPVSVNKPIWDKFLSIAIGEYASYIAPENIIFCEGTTQGRKRKDFDANCYSKIFQDEFPETYFHSLGSCNDIERDKGITINAIKAFAPASTFTHVIDKDTRTKEEIDDLKAAGIKVLGRRHLESYLLDDEIITKLCNKYSQSKKVAEAIEIKNKAIEESITTRGNDRDDIKSAAGTIYGELRKLLSLNSSGTTAEFFLRDIMAPLITRDTATYIELKRDIFE